MIDYNQIAALCLLANVPMPTRITTDRIMWLKEGAWIQVWPETGTWACSWDSAGGGGGDSTRPLNHIEDGCAEAIRKLSGEAA